MLKRSVLTVFLLAALTIPASAVFAHDHDDDAGDVVGVWACDGARPDASTFPLNFIFHDDGVFGYSSGSKIHARQATLGGVAYPFTDRGGAFGHWAKIGRDRYSWKTMEILYNYDSPNDWVGTLFVNATVKYDRKADTLCSGRSECAGEKTRVLFCPADYRNTSECQYVEANSICYRFDARFPVY